MMLKVKSNPWARYRFALFLPVALLVVNVYGRPEITDKLDLFGTIKINEFISNEEIVIQDNDTIFRIDIDKIVQESLKEVENRLSEMDIEKLVEDKMKDIDWEDVNEKIKLAEVKLKELDIDKFVEEKVKEAEVKVKVEARLQNIEDQLVKMEYNISGDANSASTAPVVMSQTNTQVSGKVYIIIDGKPATEEELKEIEMNPSEIIESISIYKSDQAIAKYGEQGKNGVMEVITRNVLSGE